MDQKGFLGALLDFSFKEFVTIKIIRFLYGLVLVLIALGAVAGVITALVTMFTQGFFQGLFLLIVAPIAALIYLILARVWTEIVIVLFRVAENTSELVALKKSEGSGAPPAP